MTEEKSPNNDHIDQDTSPISMGDAAGGIHDSTIAKRDSHVHGDKVASARGEVAEEISESVVITGDDNKVTIQRLDPTDIRNQRKHKIMRQLVHSFWIAGVLKHSLENEVLIQLNVTEMPDAIDNHSWDSILQQPEHADNTLPPTNINIIEAFAQNQQLLILGEPGSGKTTMLLALTEELLQRMETDPTHLTPVVFNLSSWAENGLPLVGWLTEELHTKYNIPKQLAQSWVENDELLLLLDGLDEVQQSRRNSCIEAINTFRQEHLVPLVICSRVAEYKALPTQLKLQGAVLVQPLTWTQMDEYLDRVGAEFSAVRAILQQNTELQGLATLPLMLSIIALAYQETKPEALEKVQPIESRHKHIFDTYIKQLFKHRSPQQPYTQKQTLTWLAWLARNMSQRQQAIFLIERLQPNWLQLRSHIMLYRLSVELIFGLLFGVVYGLSGVLMGVLIPEQSGGLFTAVTIGAKFGLALGVIIGLFFLLSDIKPTERIVFSRNLNTQALMEGLVFGVTLSLIVDLLNLLLVVESSGLLDEIIFTLVIGLIFGLFLGFLKKEDITQRFQPNQGIVNSIRNMLIIGLGGGLVGGSIFGIAAVLISWLGEGYSGWPIAELIFGLNFGLVVGLFVGLNYGGGAVIKHYVLRCFLYFYNYLPFNCPYFLDYAANRLFMYKVGGGYIFSNRMLLEHFAQLTEEDIRRLSTE